MEPSEKRGHVLYVVLTQCERKLICDSPLRKHADIEKLMNRLFPRFKSESALHRNTCFRTFPIA